MEQSSIERNAKWSNETSEETCSVSEHQNSRTRRKVCV